MPNYLKISMRFCMLFALILTVVLLSKPQKAQAFTCIGDCSTQWHACIALCNGLPGDDPCFEECGDQLHACDAGCV
jgi:hypothetical protein